jgi:hypothetical protein
MGNTANNNWPYPESTDLVKDGATAIENLADAIDTTLGVYSPATPMGVHLSTVSFSAVASQSINDVFSTTYDNYKVILNLDSASSALHDTYFRLRVGGADLSSGTYNGSAALASTGGVVASYSTTRTGWQLASETIAAGCQIFMELGNPFRTTGKHTAYWNTWGVASGNDSLKLFNGQVAAGTSYTGFSIVNIGTGTITGSVSVYGYSK